MTLRYASINDLRITEAERTLLRQWFEGGALMD